MLRTTYVEVERWTRRSMREWIPGSTNTAESNIVRIQKFQDSKNSERLQGTRRTRERKPYDMILTFKCSYLPGSICWIAVFSYLMVWWATVVGDTFGIPSEVSF